MQRRAHRDLDGEWKMETRKETSWLTAAALLLVPVALRVLLVAGLTVGAARGLLPAAAADACLAALGLSAW